MTDPRLSGLAAVLVHHSLRLKGGDQLLINAEPLTGPLVKEVYREALRAGAHAYVKLQLSGLDEIFFKEASHDQLGHVSEVAKFEVEKISATLYIYGSDNKRARSSVPPERLSVFESARRDLSRRVLERAQEGELRWCVTQYPTSADAQDAEMSVEDYEDFLFGANFLTESDPVARWRALSSRQQEIVEYLTQYDEMRIVGRDTDLRFRVGGRRWVNCDGQCNLPDGEIFTSPVEDSVEGTIRFTFPAIYRKREASDVRLSFKSGTVVDATASKGEEYLASMLNMDEGARRVGEFAFGTNPSIDRYTRNGLLDEKIDGTIHLALGASLPEAGGKNVSALHWDMICDLREGGEVFGDGKQIYRNGRFLTS
jgi:aminopeptidase